MIQASGTFHESGGAGAESVPAALALLWVMSSCMERIHKRDWDRREEIGFYKQIFGQPTSLNPEEKVVLEWLHYQAGGWWAWVDDEASGPSFFPTQTWNPYFNSKRGER